MLLREANIKSSANGLLSFFPGRGKGRGISNCPFRNISRISARSTLMIHRIKVSSVFFVDWVRGKKVYGLRRQGFSNKLIGLERRVHLKNDFVLGIFIQPGRAVFFFYN